MADPTTSVAAPVAIPTQDLVKDVFEAERRGQAVGDTFRVPGSAPLSAEQVLSDYASTYTDVSDDREQNLRALGTALGRQGFRLDELVQYAKTDPDNYGAYREVRDFRQTEGTGEDLVEFTEEDLVKEDQPLRSIGTEGVLYNDAPDAVLSGQLAHPVDPVYEGIDKLAGQIYESLEDAEKAEIASWEDGTEINMAWVNARAERALKDRGVAFGTNRYAEELRKEQRRQLRSLMVLRTAGYWDGVVRTPEDLFDSTKTPESWYEGMQQAVTPTRRLVGYDKNGKLVYDQEARSLYTLNMLDIPRMLILGAYEHGFGDSWRGVEDRASATRGGYYAGKKTGIPGAKYVGGALGLGLDMFTPDALAVTSKFSKVASTAVKGSKLVRAPKLKVAKQLYKAEKLLNQGVAEQSHELIRQGVDIITKVKLENPKLQGHINRVVEDVGAKFAETSRAALDEAADLSDEAIEYHRKVLITAGDLLGKDDVAKPLEKVLGPENFNFGGKQVELRTGVRRKKSKAPKSGLMAAQVRQGEDSVFNFAKVLDDLDEAEQVIRSAGTFVPDAKAIKKRAKVALRNARKEVAAEARELGKKYNVPSKVVNAALKEVEKAAKRSEDAIAKIIKESGAGTKGATQADLDKLFSSIDNEITKAIDEFAGQGLTAILDNAVARSRTKAMTERIKTQNLKSAIPEIDEEIARLQKRVSEISSSVAPQTVSGLTDSKAPFLYASKGEASSALLGGLKGTAEDLRYIKKSLRKQATAYYAKVVKAKEDPLQVLVDDTLAGDVASFVDALARTGVPHNAEKLLEKLVNNVLNDDDIRLLELAANAYYKKRRRELMEIKADLIEVTARLKFQKRLDEIFEKGAIDFNVLDDKLKIKQEVKDVVARLQKEVRRQAVREARIQTDLGFVARESEAMARKVLNSLEKGKGRDIVSRAEKLLKLDLNADPEVAQAVAELGSKKSGFYVQAAKRWAGAALRRIELEQALNKKDITDAEIQKIGAKILKEREKESLELVKFFEVVQNANKADEKMATALANVKAEFKRVQKSARDLRKLTRDVAKHNRKMERKAKSLQTAYKAKTKRLLRTTERRQRLMEKIAKRGENTPEVLDKTAFFARLAEIGSDMVGSAMDDIAEQIFTKNPVKVAEDEIETLRAATYLNAKYLAEGVGAVARQLELDLSLTADIADTAKMQRRPFGFGGTLLDPDSVTNPIDMLSQKYGISGEVIKRRAMMGDPIVVESPDGKLVLSAEYLSSETIKQQTKEFIETATQARSVEIDQFASGIAEQTPTEKLDSILVKWAASSDRQSASAISTLYKFVFGGPINVNTLDIAPSMREVVKRIPRVVNQTVADLTRLMQDEDFDGVYRFMAGLEGKFQSGRHIISSGYVSVPESVSLTIERMLLTIEADARIGPERAYNIRRLLAQPLNESGLIADMESIRQTDWGKQAIDDLVGMLKAGQDELADGMKVAGEGDKASKLKTPHVINDVLQYMQADQKNSAQFQLETLSFFSVAYNAGRGVVTEAEKIEAARRLAQGAYDAFGGAAKHERAVTAMNRALPILTAHTAAAVELRRIGNFNISVTETDFKHWNNFLEGLPVPREWRNTVGENLIKLYGDRTKFGEFSVMGEKMYLPIPVVRSFDEAIVSAKDVAADLIKDPSDTDQVTAWMANAITTVLKTRVIGAFIMRPKYIFAAIYEGFDNAAVTRSVGVATTHALRMFSQVPMSIPGVIQSSTALRKMGDVTEYLAEKGYGDLDEVPSFIKTMISKLKNANPTEVQAFLGSMGDAAAEKFGAFIGHGKWSVDTNKIMQGSDDVVELPGGSIMTYKDLKRALIAEGVVSDSYQKSYLRSSIYNTDVELVEGKKVVKNGALKGMAKELVDKAGSSMDGMHKIVSDYAEQLGERERISMFISCLNEGLTVPEAAALTRKILHDYQGNMSKWDMNVFVRMVIPYFTYRKNNNRLNLDLMLDPRTAYRLSARRNAVKGAIVLAQETINDVYQDELGVQTHLIEDEETRRKYEALRDELLRLNGGKALSPQQRAVFRGYLFGQDRLIEGGRQYLVPEQHMALRNISELIGVNSAVAPTFNSSYLPKYMQIRDVLVLPQDLSSPGYKENMDKGNPVVWNYIALPESGQVAFLEHLGTIVSALSLSAQSVAAPMFAEDYALTQETYQHLVSSSLTELLQPEFSPITHFIMKSLGVSQDSGQYKMRISKRVFDMLALHAPDWVETRGGKVVDGVVVEEPRYYTAAWVGESLSLIAPLAHAGVSETTKMAKDFRQPTVETGEPVYDFSMNFLRFAGIQIERTDAERAKIMATQRFQSVSTTPPE